MAANTRQGATARGRDISDAELIAEAATCGVPENKVRKMIAEVNVALKQHRLRQKKQLKNQINGLGNEKKWLELLNTENVVMVSSLRDIPI